MYVISAESLAQCLQRKYLQETESLEGSGETFLIDEWATEPSRKGITAVIQDGTLLEKVCAHYVLFVNTYS